jgi:polyhydroxyalkanoate synthesis regulator phasin
MVKRRISVPLDIYEKEMREMQREINYLRKRVTQLNDELDKHKKYTQSSIEYIEGSVDDLQYEFDLQDLKEKYDG